MIRRTKPSNKGQNNAITIDNLATYFTDKFGESRVQNEFIQSADARVQETYDDKLCNSNVMKQTVIPFQSVKRYIKQLNTNCSPGVDCVTSEHLKYASNSSIPLHLSKMLSLCITYGIVPDSFYQGLLIPVLKKNDIDPSLAHHYRPITVSTTFSKLLELYIIDNCHGHVFDPLQFGFIDGREQIWP